MYSLPSRSQTCRPCRGRRRPCPRPTRGSSSWCRRAASRSARRYCASWRLAVERGGGAGSGFGRHDASRLRPRGALAGGAARRNGGVRGARGARPVSRDGVADGATVARSCHSAERASTRISSRWCVRRTNLAGAWRSTAAIRVHSARCTMRRSCRSDAPRPPAGRSGSRRATRARRRPPRRGRGRSTSRSSAAGSPACGRRSRLLEADPSLRVAVLEADRVGAGARAGATAASAPRRSPTGWPTGCATSPTSSTCSSGGRREPRASWSRSSATRASTRARGDRHARRRDRAAPGRRPRRRTRSSRPRHGIALDVPRPGRGPGRGPLAALPGRASGRGPRAAA